jgi:hypothetical protein
LGSITIILFQNNNGLSNNSSDTLLYFLLLKGFGKANIKRQLQDVAEGVAASVLQPSFPEKPAAFSGDHIDSHGAVIDVKVQVGNVSIFTGLKHCSLICRNLLLYFWVQGEGNNQSDKTSQGIQVLDDIDKLQVLVYLLFISTPYAKF